MKNTAEIFLKEDLINKETLLMKRHTSIGLNREHAFLILNIMELQSTSKRITLNAISKNFNLPKTDVEKLLSDLIEMKAIKVKFTKSEMEINFKILFDRLLKTYFTPSVNAEYIEIEKWIERILEIKLTSSNKRNIQSWINEKGTKRLISIIEGIYKFNIKDIEFKIIKELYSAESVEKKAKLEELDGIIKFDWVTKK